MEVIVINELQKDIKELFSRYVPTEFEHYFHKDAILLGAVDTSDSLVEPVGLAIMTEYEGQLAIKWMWVDPEKRFKEAGSRLLEECFNIADENGLEILNAHVPVLDAETVDDSDIVDFFYENDFRYVGDADTEDGKVFVLTADVDTAVSLENDEENRRIAQARIERDYKKFPKNFKVSDVEYFSGVPVE